MHTSSIEVSKDLQTQVDLNETQLILTKALALLGPNGERWCKGALAKGDSFCALGAVLHVKNGNAYAGVTGRCGDLLQAAASKRGAACVASYNNADAREFADISDLFHDAIVLAGQSS